MTCFPSPPADKIEHMRQQLMGQARISKATAAAGGGAGGAGGQGAAPGTDVQLLVGRGAGQGVVARALVAHVYKESAGRAGRAPRRARRAQLLLGPRWWCLAPGSWLLGPRVC